MELEEFEEAEVIVNRMRGINRVQSLLERKMKPVEVKIEFEYNQSFSTTDSELIDDIMSLINDKYSTKYEELEKKMRSL